MLWWLSHGEGRDAVTWCGWDKLWKGRNYWKSRLSCQLYGLRGVSWWLCVCLSDLTWLPLLGVGRKSRYIIIITLFFRIMQMASRVKFRLLNSWSVYFFIALHLVHSQFLKSSLIVLDTVYCMHATDPSLSYIGWQTFCSIFFRLAAERTILSKCTDLVGICENSQNLPILSVVSKYTTIGDSVKIYHYCR